MGFASPDRGIAYASSNLAGYQRSCEWMDVLHVLPSWFQQRTVSDIRALLGRELREARSIGCVTIGWQGNTILRLVTRDRRLIMLAIGAHGDFAIETLSDDVDSSDPDSWAELLDERRILLSFSRRGIRIRLPEEVTTEAHEAMRRCPQEPRKIWHLW